MPSHGVGLYGGIFRRAVQLHTRLHEALIKRSYEDRLVGHISRDSTAIEAREKPVETAAPAPSKRKRGRPKKGELVKGRRPKKEGA